MCGEPAPPNIREVLNPFVEARVPKMLRLRPAERPVREEKAMRPIGAEIMAIRLTLSTIVTVAWSL